MRLIIILLAACIFTACASNRPTKAGMYKNNSIPEFVKQK